MSRWFPNRTGCFAAISLVFALGWAGIDRRRANAQPPPVTPPGASEPLIELNLRGSVPLQTLVEAVSRQLDLRFLYGADLANRQVTVFTPAKLPRSALPILLGSLLRGENLAIVDSDVPGWKRIIDVADMAPFATPGNAAEVLQRDGPAAAVTQVFAFEHARPENFATLLRPFLSQKGANVAALPEEGLLIITDYAANLRTIAELIRIIDQPTNQVVIEFHPVRSRTPEALIDQAEALLAESASKTTDAVKIGEVKLFADASGKRVVVAGIRARVDEALRLLDQLDSGADVLTRVYRLQNVSAERIDHLVRGLVSANESERAIETTIDEEGNLLIVRAPAQVHEQLRRLLEQLDQPVDSAESPIRFYKLRNANAIEVLYSLLALQEVTGTGQQLYGGSLLPGGATLATPFAGMGAVPGGVLQVFENSPPSMRLPPPPQNNVDGMPGALGPINQNRALGSLIDPTGLAGGFGVGGGLGLGGGLAAGQVATLPGGARVSADVGTNSLIVYAPANVQPLYEKLIRSLDQRRPQVMIEAVVVAVDTTDQFSFGVEVSGGDRLGVNKLFAFTSYGLSTVDPSNGFLTVDPSLGFNGVLIDPAVADAIIQALVSHTRGQVIARPKILVNDNQTGSLESVASIPFQSVNSANTISTTSLGGDQQAGTIITVTPHINEDDHLQLEFEVEFSSFVGNPVTNADGDQVLPPSRQIDRVGSVVTIPDGQTVVVGGLKRVTDGRTYTGIPWIEKIPVVRTLTGLTTENKQTTSFFLFIRPKILRDSRFRDLRYLSEVQLHNSPVGSDYPTSGPLLISCPTPPPDLTSRSVSATR